MWRTVTSKPIAQETCGGNGPQNAEIAREILHIQMKSELLLCGCTAISPLAFGSNESRHEVAIVAGSRFSELSNVVLTFFTDGRFPEEE